MSTKSSIKFSNNFHLYDEAFERQDNPDSPVYLELHGVQVHELSTAGGSVTLMVELPREMARALGLLSVSAHGVNCEKVPHAGEGYLHASDDDKPYDVDGVSYCGRCHGFIGR